MELSRKTVCWLIEDLKRFDGVKDDVDICRRLDEIKYKVGRMEDRLLEYCNAIEDLGYIRIGRDYDKQ